jgi:hypothetical protein
VSIVGTAAAASGALAINARQLAATSETKSCFMRHT